MAKFVRFPSAPHSMRSSLLFGLLGLAVVACATANDEGIPLPDGSGGTVDTSFGGTATGGSSGSTSAAGSGTSGATSIAGTGSGGQSPGGATGSGGGSGSTSAFGGSSGSTSGGTSSAAGASGTGGTSAAGGSGGHAGSGSSGSGSGGTGVAVGGSAGMAGSAGTGTAGTAGSAGTGGTTGGTGCNAPGWINGFAYQSGAVVTAICQDVGGGTTVCTSGKKYPWTCFGSQCSFNGPGVAGWWGNWSIGTVCN